ncbi:oxidoreductase SDR family [Nocardia nova SH22a]|uniref:Oxidoreductase SDR family n=1 Tax=Nocardia nova SH22a TaxID=1415166 RepID=W5TJZ2_9NOCA|nr:mycofactocin-coupled SDR family oxidoreductase [Nocardia nova]AHH17561.1 oxidoreductase SDR family [Nocardia nova SH22a]
MGRLEGRVALVTGAARGQGRSHAVRLAQEGADVIAIDRCADIDSVAYPLATSEELEETARLVKETGRRVVSARADVRDSAAMAGAVDAAVAELGRLDIVSANAGILSIRPAVELDDEAWEDVIGVNLNGVWNTCKVSMPHLIAGGRGGAMILTSSTSGVKGSPNLAHYTAAKHGVVGLMKVLAKELAVHDIRVNTVHPTIVPTVMMTHDEMYRLFRPDVESPTLDDAKVAYTRHNLLNVPWVEAEDISNAVVFLASDEGRYVTGLQMLVDAGQTL